MSSNRLTVLAMGLALTVLSACGPRGSGYAPAENALSATPEDIIVMYENDYDLPETEALSGLVATAATGDASGGQTLALQQDRSPARAQEGAITTDEGVTEEVDPLQDELEDTSEEVAEAVLENVGDPGVSTTLTDELNRAETDEEIEDTEALAPTVDDVPTDDVPADDVSAEAEEASETADEAEPSDRAEEAEASEPLSQAEGGFDWQALGEETYTANCSACHQATGQGIPGAFPPLAGHLPEVYDAEGGPEYLIHVLLYGLQGEIEVNGQTYNGVMPAWPQLSDEQIAAVLNHALTSWGNQDSLEAFEPFTPEDIQTQRDLDLAPADVLLQRPQLP